MTAVLTWRGAIAVLLAVYLPLVCLGSQDLTSAELKRATVIVDAKGKFRAVHLEFVVSTAQVVQRVTLSFRKMGSPDYAELKLKLNPELVYEGVIPYADRIEYYLTVLPEKGAPSNVGSSTSPRIVASEDLPRVKEKQIGHHKVIFVVVVASIAVAVFALFGFHEEKRQPKQP